MKVQVIPGWFTLAGGGTLVRTTWRAARLSVARGTCWGWPLAPISVHVRPVSVQRSSFGSVSVTVTVLPLVRSRWKVPPAERLNDPLDQGEPASVEEDVKPKVRAGGDVPLTCLTMVRVRACTIVP